MNTCRFDPSGATLQECKSRCNTETQDLCGNFCEMTCNGCADPATCPWLNNTTNAPEVTTTKAPGPPIYTSNRGSFNQLVARMMEYAKYSDMLLEEGDDVSGDLAQLEDIKDDSLRREIVYNYLMGSYDLNTELLAEHYEETKKVKSNVDQKENVIKYNKKQKKKLMEELIKKEELYRIKLGKYNKMVLETETLQYLFYYSVFLLLLPLVYLMNVVPNIVAFIVWLVLLALGITAAMYRIFRESKGRDKLYYNKYNFNKPNRENILRSRLKQELDSKCADNKDAECDFDPNMVDIGDVSQWKNKNPNNI